MLSWKTKRKLTLDDDPADVAVEVLRVLAGWVVALFLLISRGLIVISVGACCTILVGGART